MRGDRKRYIVGPLTEEQQALVLQWTPLACKIAKRHAPKAYGPDWDAVRSTAVLGLMLAAQRFDPSLGVQFNTYAFMWVRQSLCREIDFQKKRIKPISFAAIGSMDIDFDNPSDYDPEDFAIDCDPSREATIGDMVERCQKWVPRQWWEVLVMRFQDGLTLEEISQQLGVTRERIRQVERNAIAKIRERMAIEYAEYQHSGGQFRG